MLDESGRSSWELLQNCYAIADYKEQKIALALALTEHFLKKIGDGCCRIHGGGFAGVIVALIPQDEDAGVRGLHSKIRRNRERLPDADQGGGSHSSGGVKGFLSV